MLPKYGGKQSDDIPNHSRMIKIGEGQVLAVKVIIGILWH